MPEAGHGAAPRAGQAGASATPGSPSRSRRARPWPSGCPRCSRPVYGCHVLERGDLAGEARYLAVTLATLLGGPAGGLGSRRARHAVERPGPGTRRRALRAARRAGPTVLERTADPGGGGVPAAREHGGRRAVPAGGRHPGRALRPGQDRHDRLGGPAPLYTALGRWRPRWVPRSPSPAWWGRLDGPDGRARHPPGPPAGGRGAFQPWWATRAHLLAGAGRVGEAAAAFTRAAELADDDAVRAHLLARQARVLGVRWGPETAGGE